MNQILALLALLVALVLLSACGQKGPLYLRDSPPPGVRPEKPAPVKPTPYPAESAGPTQPDKAEK